VREKVDETLTNRSAKEWRFLCARTVGLGRDRTVYGVLWGHSHRSLALVYLWLTVSGPPAVGFSGLAGGLC
jgi:hypothetical protein